MCLYLYSFHHSLPTCAPIIPKQQDASSRFTFKDHKNSMTPRGINEYSDLALLQSRRQGNSCGKPASPGHYMWICSVGVRMFCFVFQQALVITHGCFVGVRLFCFVFCKPWSLHVDVLCGCGAVLFCILQALVITRGCFVWVFCFVFGFLSLVLSLVLLLLLLFGGSDSLFLTRSPSPFLFI